MTVAVASVPVSVPRLWPGETAVIIGGGSSLTPADVEACRGRARVIAIKEAGCCHIPGKTAPAPWADVLYAADYKYWKFVGGAPEFEGLKYAIEQSETPPIEWPDVQVLRNTGTEGLETDPTGLRTGFNSGYQSIGLACHLGVSRIILLGFDCWRGPSGDQNWFGYHPLHTASPYPIFIQAFASLVEPLKTAGVEVINCSRGTILRVFPRASLQDVLR